MIDQKKIPDSTKADLEKKFVSYISSLLHFNSINFDKKIRKYNERYPLIMEDVEESQFGYVEGNAIELDLNGLESQISDPALHKLFLKLSSREKEILNLTYVENKKDAEIAEKLRISQQSISKTRKNALNKLRISLNMDGNK